MRPKLTEEQKRQAEEEWTASLSDKDRMERDLLRRIYERGERAPVWYLDQALRLSLWSSSGLEWRLRPRWHFVNADGYNRFRNKLRRHKAGCLVGKRRSSTGYFQVQLDGRNYRASWIVEQLVDLKMARYDRLSRNVGPTVFG